MAKKEENEDWMDKEDLNYGPGDKDDEEKQTSGNFKIKVKAQSKKATEGSFAAKLVGVREQMAQSSGNEMIVFDFKLLEGDGVGEVYPVFAVLTEQALWKLSQVMKALGCEKNDNDEYEEEAESLKGRPVVVVVKNKLNPSSGEIEPSIVTVKPPTDEAIELAEYS